MSFKAENMTGHTTYPKIQDCGTLHRCRGASTDTRSSRPGSYVEKLHATSLIPATPPATPYQLVSDNLLQLPALGKHAWVDLEADPETEHSRYDPKAVNDSNKISRKPSALQTSFPVIRTSDARLSKADITQRGKLNQKQEGDTLRRSHSTLLRGQGEPAQLDISAPGSSSLHEEERDVSSEKALSVGSENLTPPLPLTPRASSHAPPRTRRSIRVGPPFSAKSSENNGSGRHTFATLRRHDSVDARKYETSDSASIHQDATHGTRPEARPEETFTAESDQRRYSESLSENALDAFSSEEGGVRTFFVWPKRSNRQLDWSVYESEVAIKDTNIQAMPHEELIRRLMALGPSLRLEIEQICVKLNVSLLTLDFEPRNPQQSGPLRHQPPVRSVSFTASNDGSNVPYERETERSRSRVRGHRIHKFGTRYKHASPSRFRHRDLESDPPALIRAAERAEASYRKLRQGDRNYMDHHATTLTSEDQQWHRLSRNFNQLKSVERRIHHRLPQLRKAKSRHAHILAVVDDSPVMATLPLKLSAQALEWAVTRQQRLLRSLQEKQDALEAKVYPTMSQDDTTKQLVVAARNVARSLGTRWDRLHDT